MNVYLHRKSWSSLVAGASHYHGDLESENGTITVTHRISERMAAKLNQESRGLQLGQQYRPGSLYPGFDSPEELTRAAITEFQERFGADDVLYNGPRYTDPPILAYGSGAQAMRKALGIEAS